VNTAPKPSCAYCGVSEETFGLSDATYFLGRIFCSNECAAVHLSRTSRSQTRSDLYAADPSTAARPLAAAAR
jgi:hypothetical protein